MRCSICDRPLADTEVIWNKETQTWEICPTCLTIAHEAAFTNGFSKDTLTDEEKDIEYVYGSGAAALLDQEAFNSYVDDTSRWE